MRSLKSWGGVGLLLLIGVGCSSFVDDEPEANDGLAAEALVSSSGSGSGGGNNGGMCTPPGTSCSGDADDATFDAMLEAALAGRPMHISYPPPNAPCRATAAEFLTQIFKQPKIPPEIAREMYRAYRHGFRGCGGGCGGLLAYCTTLVYPLNNYCAAVATGVFC